MILILVLLTSSAGGQRCWPCSNQADCSVETFNPTASIPCSTQCFSSLDSNSLIVDAGCVTTEDCDDSDILCCPANNDLPNICRIQQFGEPVDPPVGHDEDQYHPFDLLPRMIWIKIMSKLRIRDVLNMSEMNSSIAKLILKSSKAQLANENHLWKKLYRRDFKSDFIYLRYPHLVASMRITDSPTFARSVSLKSLNPNCRTCVADRSTDACLFNDRFWLDQTKIPLVKGQIIIVNLNLKPSAKAKTSTVQIIALVESVTKINPVITARELKMTTDGDKIEKLNTRFFLPPPTDYDQDLAIMNDLGKLDDILFYESLKELVITNIFLTEQCPDNCPCFEK